MTQRKITAMAKTWRGELNGQHRFATSNYNPLPLRKNALPDIKKGVGFDWGNKSHASLVLAASILADYGVKLLENDPIIEEFRDDVIAGLDHRKVFRLTHEQVGAWLERSEE